MWQEVSNRFLHSSRFWQVSVWRFYCLKSSLMASNQPFFGQPQLLFPSTCKCKICSIYPVYSSLHFTCPNQRSLLHLNTESRVFSLIRLRREFVLTRCSFLMFHIHKRIALSLRSKCFLSSFLKAQYSDESSSVPLTRLLYIWPHVSTEIALQLSKSNISLNFHHAEQCLLIVPSSLPPPGQMKSPR